MKYMVALSYKDEVTVVQVQAANWYQACLPVFREAELLISDLNVEDIEVAKKIAKRNGFSFDVKQIQSVGYPNGWWDALGATETHLKKKGILSNKVREVISELRKNQKKYWNHEDERFGY